RAGKTDSRLLLRITISGGAWPLPVVCCRFAMIHESLSETPAVKSEETAPRSNQQAMEDIGFMTCMTLTLLGNYAQTGHFGGPLAYTPLNVVAHLIGPEAGGLRYDYRRPKHPWSDKFM